MFEAKMQRSLRRRNVPSENAFSFFATTTPARADRLELLEGELADGPQGPRPKLKGSIGEGSNHSNFSRQSSVKILSKFNAFCYKIQKIQDFSTFSKIFAKFRQNFIKH